MEDDLNILVNGRRPPKLKTNSFKEQHSTVTSRNLTNTTSKQILARLKKQKQNQP
jgi:hypothetical protein